MVGLSITNDRQAQQAESRVSELTEALSSDQVFSSMVEGLPSGVTAGFRRSLATEKREINEQLEAYKGAKLGNLDGLRKVSGTDLGSQLIIARIAKGLSQKELARRLGLKEQAIQRYEAERYRSISLAGFQKFASVLGLKFAVSEPDSSRAIWDLAFDVDHAALNKVLKHARANGWLKSDDDSEEKAIEGLKRSIGDHVARHSTPSLLRTGLNVLDKSDDLALLAWKAHVTRRAEQIIRDRRPRFKLTDVRWLRDLVRMSASVEALCQVGDFLLQRGIVLIFEPQIPGMKVDGASFLVDDIPIIGMTLLKDTLDNFWFTLLHEIAHVILHFQTGLQAGFFDDVDCEQVDEIENEANQFAANLLIPEDIWVRSPARISKSPEPIESLAKQLGIHPAIIFGKVRMERRNYAIFSDRIGSGSLRKRLLTGEMR